MLQFIEIDPLTDPRNEEHAGFPLAHQIYAAPQPQAAAGQDHNRVGRGCIVLGGRRGGEANKTDQHQRAERKTCYRRAAQDANEPSPSRQSVGNRKTASGRSPQDPQCRPARSPQTHGQ
jgi:hypothetical protein